jgi:hypothetical protein
MKISNEGRDTKELNKIRKINVALMKNDVEKLMWLAISSGGLLMDGLRSRVWPILIKHSDRCLKSK